MASNNITETTTDASLEVIQTQSNPIFLQTTAAQVIAGLFVWTAVFVTCQQVRFIFVIINSKYFIIFLNIITHFYIYN